MDAGVKNETVKHPDEHFSQKNLLWLNTQIKMQSRKIERKAAIYIKT